MEIDIQEVYKWLREYYQKTHPELLQMLAMRYEYATGPYPPTVQLQNRYWLLRQYIHLKRWAKVE